MPRQRPTLTFEDGWVRATYDGPVTATLHMSLDGGETWHPAFVEKRDDGRVTQIRPHGASGNVSVSRRVGERVEQLGTARV